LKLEGDTREELEQSAAELNERIAAYQVCGTRHIEIYDPAGVTLAADRCGDKSGLAFLRAWMGEELGLTTMSCDVWERQFSATRRERSEKGRDLRLLSVRST